MSRRNEQKGFNTAIFSLLLDSDFDLHTCFSASKAGESVSRRRFESGTFFTIFSFYKQKHKQNCNKDPHLAPVLGSHTAICYDFITYYYQFLFLTA